MSFTGSSSRCRTAGLGIAGIFLVSLLAASSALGNPPYRTPDPPPPSPPPLTAAQQARVMSIVQREQANYGAFETRLQAGINRVRVARGDYPLGFSRISGGGCIRDEEMGAQINNSIRRTSRVHQRIQEAAVRWVRQNPGTRAWDRVVRWWRGNDNDGPPSSGGGGNLGTDFGLDDVDLHGNPDERAGSEGMRTPRTEERDGVPSENPADPDNLPHGPSLFVIPPAPGSTVPGFPSGLRFPESVPFFFRVPAVVDNGRPGRDPASSRLASNCSCSSTPAATAATRRPTGPVHIAGLRPPPTVIRENGDDLSGPPSGTPPPTGTDPPPGPTPPLDSTPPSPDGPAIGEFGVIGLTQFHLTRQNNRSGPWENCYTIKENTTHDGQIKRLVGKATVASSDQGRTWTIKYQIATRVEREDTGNPLAAGQKNTLEVNTTYHGTFERQDTTLQPIKKTMTGQYCFLNTDPPQPPQCTELTSDDIPNPLPGTETRIKTLNRTHFQIQTTTPGQPTQTTTLPKHPTPQN